MTRNGDPMKTYTLTEAEVAAIIQQAFDTILPARDQAIADAVAETVAAKVRAEYDELVHALMELVGVKTDMLEVEAAVKRR